MVNQNFIHTISSKWMLVVIFIILVPNFLLMKLEILGFVTPLMAVGTVIDLTIILPLIVYFFILKRKPSFIIFVPVSFAGLFLANWFIPDYADQYLNHINKAVILAEVSIILLELLFILYLFKRLPLLKENIRVQREEYHHFLRSFMEAVKQTFSFRIKKLNQYQKVLQMLSTDLAVIYYVFFSWRKKGKSTSNNTLHFSYHKNGEYLGVFIMLAHALAIEIIAVHLLLMQISHLLAWVITLFDLFALCYLIADYRAITLSPVVLDSKGIHLQKGLRFHVAIPYEKIGAFSLNDRPIKEIDKDKGALNLTLNGFEKQLPQFVVYLTEPVVSYRAFGLQKIVNKVYLSVDEGRPFQDSLEKILKEKNE
ncbi:hypothetical protein HNQ94_002626 [Salirhabdus euzebyi]|uniref:Beta-carotene 15,15'-monooxygenase n=1 Tax=Salirhabdus euzebyi TaxID=394506 RepID=A0A841Q718_9BACI|nr:hypothetical protein [Salirhabdus euzebyi]MBB6454175.1 hypothetical protein [Salirhabdus euzebyi]